MDKKRVLVYPCGTEIGLEIYRAVQHSIHFSLIGGSSSYDHGRFVYQEHIDGLPFITDQSGTAEIDNFNRIIKAYNIDYIFPAMDGVIYKFAEYRDRLDCVVIAPDFGTVCITRSKKRTYEYFAEVLEVPAIFQSENSELLPFPLFLKPDIGQGSQGAHKVNNPEDLKYYLSKYHGRDMLLLEYLPGEEYTIDCFSNQDGRLLYAEGRRRRRVKNGISVSAVQEKQPVFWEFAEKINARLNFRGGWFFQLKKNAEGDFFLLEIASRIAGTSALVRNLGVNCPLLTLFLYSGNKINSIICNTYDLELDRALYNKFRTNIRYSRVYVDYDDTLVVNGKVNIQLVALLYQCINEAIPITLLTKHAFDLSEDLRQRRLELLFDEIVHLSKEEHKFAHIKEKSAIFIDDSYGERAETSNQAGIPVFDTHMIECLLH